MSQNSNNQQQEQKDEFELGKVLVFDKPLDWTSFDIVNKIRYMLRHYRHLKKIKVGHAGTLDPLATGILIVCTGKKTKEITTYQDHDKEYVAKVKLGATTPSYDLETEIDSVTDASHITENEVKACLETFLGEQEQYPPVYSAKKIDGKPAFVLAHQGRGDEVKMRPHVVVIHELEVLSWDDSNKEFELRVACSKGTYIRSLAHDIGKKLGVGAHLTGLRRTKIGEITLKDAITIENFEKNLADSQIF
ncbi:MAG: tRNA pseudouridine(55) synthase TruB [Bacteroidales bacterium]|nr:tRNA pseudouridine(55) synthase TruB [Bacteroidales bacterium]